MDILAACPVCGKTSWSSFNSHTFKRQHDIKDPYFANRQDALFNVWFVDAEEVILKGAYCDFCGFITYLPRPTELDISNKYAWLAEREGKNAPARSDFVIALEGNRSNRLRRDTFRFTSNPKTILDFGGGDGHLMRSFLSAGSDCFLVDYSASSVPGVSKLGDTLDDVDPSARFDLIICSHVLEHLSEPASTLRDLRSLSELGSVLYCEVPFELRRGLTLENDPVTHVNFFTKESLQALLRSAGWRPLSARYFSTTYNKYPLRACYVVAEASDDEYLRSDVRTTPPPWIRRSVKQMARARLIDLDVKVHFGLSALSVTPHILTSKFSGRKTQTSGQNNSG